MSRLDFGICFGGSYMSIAYSKDGRSSIVVNEAGYRTTPSVISIHDNETLVGIPAKQNLIRNSKNSILFTKHFIGQAQKDISAELLKKIDIELKKDNEDNEIVFMLDKNGKSIEYKLNEAIENQLKYLNTLAKSSLGVKDCDAVLAVPRYFSEKQRNYLSDCAKKAGFNVQRTITNPVAACLAYNLEEDNSVDQTILTYQMGANSIEVSLIYLSNGLYRFVDSIRLMDVGGDLFNDVIVDILCDEFKKKAKADPKTNKRSVHKLKANAEELKQILSTMERAHCSIDALYDGIDFDYYLTRQRFESGCNKLYQLVFEPINDLLRKVGSISENQIDQVILCGGSTKMCKIQSLIREKFPNATINMQQPPDEIVALGCAKQCALITASKSQKDLNSSDFLFKCLSKPLAIQIGSSNTNRRELFKVNTPLPLKKIIKIDDLNLDEPYINVVEADETFVAKIDLKSFTTKEVTLTFQIKMDETIEVNVTEDATDEKVSLFLNVENSND